MLRSVSWGQFSITLTSALVLYYGILLGIYRKQVLCWFKNLTGRRTAKTRPHNEQSPLTANPSGLPPTLAPNLEARIREAASKKMPREELIQGLREITILYPTLAGTTLQTVLNQLVAEKCQNICSISLSDVELSKLWMG
jgi:hypothetical protein